jgi:hypothetical protein
MSQHKEVSNGNTGPPRCLRLHADDNVAVTLEDVATGAVIRVGDCELKPVVAIELITRGHKIALRSIQDGEGVLKYGVAIGFASQPIAEGAWVHTHNCRSGLDERSHTLDRQTGAPTDTQYL